jgi:hypothetical protein
MPRVFIPTTKTGMMSHRTRGRLTGKGIGGVLLDGGLGGQSSYTSVDDYINTTGITPRSVIGSGSKMAMERMNKKLENLMITPTSKKVRNIKFNL